MLSSEKVKGADARTNSFKLAKEILGHHDWQVGETKVFIKVCSVVKVFYREVTVWLCLEC